MTRLRRLLNLIVIAIGAIIVRNERRDPARRPAPGRGRAAEAPSSGPAAEPPDPAVSDQTLPAPGDLRPVAGMPSNAAAAAAAVDELAQRQLVAAEACFTPGAPTTVSEEAPPRDSSASAPVGASLTDPSPDAHPVGAVPGDGTASCPPDHPIKGNAGSMIYHRPGQPSYERTVAEFCFASEQDAEAAGYRPPKR